MSRLPDLEAMAIFAKVVEMRGITAAGADLGLSPPTVSKALSRLERRLGSRLFNRTSRKLVLTEAGQQLALRATRLVADAEAAENELLAQSATPQGPVRLGAPMSFGITQVAPLLPEFLALYPRITIDLHLSDARVDLIADGFDAVLRIGILEDSSLVGRRIAAIPRVIVASPAYLDRRGRPGHPSELMDHACFGYAYTQGQRDWRFHNTAGEHVTVRPTGPLRVNNGDALMPAIMAGLGIAALRGFIVGDAVADGRLEAVLPEWLTPESSLHLLTAPGSPQPARVRVLLDFLSRRLAHVCSAHPQTGATTTV
jgi:DNA-binding transcriptional LysR family regulator